jgi:hypothetical protein
MLTGTPSFHCRLFSGSKGDIPATTMWLVSVLFILCNFLSLEPMADNLLGVDHGEEFVSQNGGDDTGTESKQT